MMIMIVSRKVVIARHAESHRASSSEPDFNSNKSNLAIADDVAAAVGCDASAVMQPIPVRTINIHSFFIVASIEGELK
jgi:hypothetical protein